MAWLQADKPNSTIIKYHQDPEKMATSTHGATFYEPCIFVGRRQVYRLGKSRLQKPSPCVHVSIRVSVMVRTTYLNNNKKNITRTNVAVVLPCTVYPKVHFFRSWAFLASFSSMVYVPRSCSPTVEVYILGRWNTPSRNNNRSESGGFNLLRKKNILFAVETF